MFGLKPGYLERTSVAEFIDHPQKVIWQPDVYAMAREMVIDTSADFLLDLGCGNADKLAALGDLWAVGVDHGENLRLARKLHPKLELYDHDLESVEALPYNNAVVVMADVIEHLRNPTHILQQVRNHHPRALLLSTPDRDLQCGVDHVGPPPNECHYREWNREELYQYLDSVGFPCIVTNTRTHSGSDEHHTLLAIWRR